MKEGRSAFRLQRLLEVCSELDVENVMEVDSRVAFQDREGNWQMCGGENGVLIRVGGRGGVSEK